MLLCQTHETGLALVERLGAMGIEVAHTFGHDNQEARAHKFAFWMGRENIKVSTFHSFKGWEGCAIVAVIEDLMDNEAKALIYMGLTRLKDSEMGSMLTVISSNPLTYEFAKRWPGNIGESL